MKNQLPKISIVVPSYNQGSFLQDALESIFSQEYPHLEVAVMDGGSNDNSIDIIHKYEPKLKFWQSQPDGGQANAINLGMQHCSGELVTWLNSDDWYMDNAFWIVARAYQENPEYGLFVGNGFRYKNGEFNPFCPRHIAISREVLREGLDYLLQPATFMSHEAWLQAGGLKTELNYGLDWDLFIRILDKQSAVTINEFLAVSREYSETKTSSGQLTRATELINIATDGTPKSLTLGSAYYLLEALLGIKSEQGGLPEGARHPVYLAMQRLQSEMKMKWNTPDFFPIHNNRQDRVFIPFAVNSEIKSRFDQNIQSLPKISIIIPSYNQADFLSRTLESIINQNYPSLEIIVFDGGSTDGSIDILEKYASRLAYWVSEPDLGPADALNKGLTKITGEIVGWLNSDDVLTQDALWHIASEFSRNPEVDVVFGNALYIDEQDRLILADHGTHRTSLYYGKLEPLSNVPYYWTYVHAIPQPTVYFKRYLLEKTGGLDQSYHFIFDFEFFWRLRRSGNFKKIERTLALYRIHSRSKTSDWNKFLIELYRFSRPLWPAKGSSEYKKILSSFMERYFSRKYGHYRRRHIIEKQLIKFVIAGNIANPEKLIASSTRKTKKAPYTPPIPNIALRENPEYSVAEDIKKYSIAFCNFIYPHHPGHSGGEIRDFHILRKLLSISSVDFFALANTTANGRQDYLRSFFHSVHTPEILSSYAPDMITRSALHLSMKTRLLLWLRNRNIPVYGPKYHNEFSKFAFLNDAYVMHGLNHVLKEDRPDFLLIGPQPNPLPLQIPYISSKTRLILSSYDVEAIRMERIAASQTGMARLALQMEARRAQTFEHNTVQYYDGIIAVSDTDKQTYIQRYQIEPDRILVLDNSVDTEYFSFKPRIEYDQPNIVFTGSLGYWPNDEAAQRLLQDIMPLVRRVIPTTRAWIVGQSPSSELLGLSDGDLNIVTGQVEDVRPFLDMATLTCIPLRTGSGTKYKVLEAAGAGTPIVCTPLALEGLSLRANDHVLVGQSDQELAEAIIKIIQNPESRRQAVENAAIHVQNHYSWISNLKKLEPWLETIQSLPKRSPTGLTRDLDLSEVKLKSRIGVLRQYAPRPLDLTQFPSGTKKTMETWPSISVVTPSYQQGEYIEQTVKSVLSQEYPGNLQYILQDGGSTDQTLHVLEKYKDQIALMNTGKDNGQAHALNLGFQHANGEILAYLNSDDIYLPFALQNAAYYFMRHPNVDVLYSHRVIINENDENIGYWVLPPFNARILKWIDYIPQETIFWRRRIWEKVGGRFDENFQYALDWEILLRFLEAGAVFKRIPAFWGAFRVYEGQKTFHDNARSAHELNLLRKKYLGFEASEIEVKKHTRAYWARSVLHNAMYQLNKYRLL